MRHNVRRLARALASLVALLTISVQVAHAQSAEAVRGAAHFEQGDYAAARADFESILQRNARDPNALYYMGRIALQESRSSDAVDWLEKAVDVNNKSSTYHYWLGAALGEEVQHASKFRQPFLARRVKTEFEQAVALDPRDVTARLGLVQFYVVAPGFMGGSMEKARQQVAELAAFNPLYGHLGDAYIALRQKDTVAVIRAYEAAITSAPDSSIGYLSLGSLYQRYERWNDAFATFDRLLKRNPDAMAAHFQIGRTAALSGQNLDRGEQSLKLWLANPPKNASRPTAAGAHHRLGQIYEKKGRTDAARAEYEEALRINPKNEDAKKSLAALR